MSDRLGKRAREELQVHEHRERRDKAGYCVCGYNARMGATLEAHLALYAKWAAQLEASKVEAAPSDTIDTFESYVSNMAETPEIAEHVYQMIAGFKDEQGLRTSQSGAAPSNTDLWDFAGDLLDAWNIEDLNPPGLREQFRDRFVARFVASQPVQVEVADALVAQAARAAYVADNNGVPAAGADWDEGRLLDWVIDRHLRLARAALSVLGGGE